MNRGLLTNVITRLLLKESSHLQLEMPRQTFKTEWEEEAYYQHLANYLEQKEEEEARRLLKQHKKVMNEIKNLSPLAQVIVKTKTD